MKAIENKLMNMLIWSALDIYNIRHTIKKNKIAENKIY